MSCVKAITKLIFAWIWKHVKHRTVQFDETVILRIRPDLYLVAANNPYAIYLSHPRNVQLVLLRTFFFLITVLPGKLFNNINKFCFIQCYLTRFPALFQHNYQEIIIFVVGIPFLVKDQKINLRVKCILLQFYIHAYLCNDRKVFLLRLKFILKAHLHLQLIL